jgi:sugar transferase (PEP-CTERM/EpsH1 system associated)
MNILYLAHRIPYPPNKGDKVRSYHELAYLARRHDLWCACFVDNPADLRHVDAVRELCRDVEAVRLFRSIATPRALWNLATGGTFTEGYFQHLRMLDTLRRWDAEVAFDAVLVFSSGMAPYAGHVRADRKVIDFCDLDSRKWLAYSARAGGPKARLLELEARRLARRELKWLDAFDAAVVITQAEAADLAETQLRHKLHVIGNGVALPDPRGDECFVDEGDGAGTPRVGFVGCMDYPPNVDAVRWFVQEIWPWIIKEIPDAVFQIVGRNPTWAVRALAGQTVEVVGEVVRVFPYLSRFDVSVSPIRVARGLQNKVLEAMVAARPVVLTSAAATGIKARDGEHFLVADDPRPFADHVVALLRDSVRRARVGQAARLFASRHHCWGREMARLESLLTSPIRARS